MPGYGAVSLSNPDDNDGNKREVNFVPKEIVTFFEGVEDLVSCQREKLPNLPLLMNPTNSSSRSTQNLAD
jgi:hypothetical protein